MEGFGWKWVQEWVWHLNFSMLHENNLVYVTFLLWGSLDVSEWGDFKASFSFHRTFISIPEKTNKPPPTTQKKDEHGEKKEKTLRWKMVKICYGTRRESGMSPSPSMVGLLLLIFKRDGGWKKVFEIVLLVLFPLTRCLDFSHCVSSHLCSVKKYKLDFVEYNSGRKNSKLTNTSQNAFDVV